jgi:hypothetical protein
MIRRTNVYGILALTFSVPYIVDMKARAFLKCLDGAVAHWKVISASKPLEFVDIYNN